MTKFTVIPVGYRLTVVSWENDGDNYQTKTKDGLTTEEVKFHIALCKLLEKFGNIVDGESDDDYMNAVSKVVKKHKNAIPASTSDVLKFALNLTQEYTGYSENYITRVYESHMVEFVPAEIKIEDVTDQF